MVVTDQKIETMLVRQLEQELSAVDACYEAMLEGSTNSNPEMKKMLDDLDQELYGKESEYGSFEAWRDAEKLRVENKIAAKRQTIQTSLGRLQVAVSGPKVVFAPQADSHMHTKYESELVNAPTICPHCNSVDWTIPRA